MATLETVENKICNLMGKLNAMTDRQTDSSKSSQKLLEDEDTQLAIISEATNNDRDQLQIAINPNHILIQVHDQDQYNKISTHKNKNKNPNKRQMNAMTMDNNNNNSILTYQISDNNPLTHYGNFVCWVFCLTCLNFLSWIHIGRRIQPDHKNTDI